ncbi:hypothetical protein DM860_015952 [Cuscuta australis]|uniref:allene-oxide cyclase n=1 Tax=Cuscuta australis TaxID=267555 RepID=A0A328DYL2_9ASTE|nr:hypothetical protein DM860_015952 [Cuscuta australis]
MVSLLLSAASNPPLIFSGVKLPKLQPLGESRTLLRFPPTAASAATPAVKGSLGLRTQLHRRPNLPSVKVQEFNVYEIDEEDRDSPAYLRLMFNKVNSLGDIVSFTNKLYSGDMQTRLGITNGICFVITHDDKTNGDRFEAVFSFYFGDYGQVSVQGPYLTYENSYLAVTGGSGIFKGVTGKVKVEPLALSPSKRFYTFWLKGIPDLPAPLRCTALPPFSTVEPSPAAVACQPGSALQNFTD